jgi:hypothetical protein
MADVELAAGATTLRLVPNEARFIPDGARFPNSIAIQPSTEDERDAKQRSIPVRVSVWDRDRTTTAQAVAFRRTSRPLRAYFLAVHGVIAVRLRTGNSRLRVIEDPLEELRDKLGGDGHCGIEGLDRQAGQPRVAWKDMLDDLARQCTEVFDPVLSNPR